jgi:hypothetical protein
MVLQRITHSGAAPPTNLQSAITATAMSFALTSSTGYPTGSGGPFVLDIDGGLPTEEKILCSSLSGGTVTVATNGRGWDGTTPVAHSPGTALAPNVSLIFSAAEADDANAHIYDTARNDHTQYARTAAGPTGPAGGDLSNTYPNPAVTGMIGYKMDWTTHALGAGSFIDLEAGPIWRTTAPPTANGQVPTWNGSTFAPTLPPTNDAQIVGLGTGATFGNGALVALVPVNLLAHCTYLLTGLLTFYVTGPSVNVDIVLYDQTTSGYIGGTTAAPASGVMCQATVQNIYTPNQNSSVALCGYCAAGTTGNARSASGALGLGGSTTLSAVRVK